MSIAGLSKYKPSLMKWIPPLSRYVSRQLYSLCAIENLNARQERMKLLRAELVPRHALGVLFIYRVCVHSPEEDQNRFLRSTSRQKFRSFSIISSDLI